MALFMRAHQRAPALAGQAWALWRSLCLGLLLVLGSLGWAQKGLPQVPALTAQVMDETGTLSAQQRQQITARLESIERQYGSQIVVLMVDSTAPEDIAAYANRVASTWKIGRKDAGDGLLFIIAKNDRSLRLEVARGLEGTIPDIAAGRIIQNNVVPVLRSGDFAAAIVAGLTAIEARLAGDELLPAPQAAPVSVAPSAPASSGWSNMLDNLFPVLFFGVPVVCSLLARAIGRPLTMLLIGGAVGVGTFVTTGSWAQTLMFAAVAAFIALCASGGGGISSGGFGRSGGWSSSSSSGRSSGRSSSGGFRSGGGGSFGGGGASGKW